MCTCWRLKSLLLLLLAAGAILLRAPPAAAIINPPASPNAFQDEDGTPTATASDEQASTGRSSTSGADDCSWLVVVADDFRTPVHEPGGERLYAESGRWLQKLCGGALVSVNDAFLIPEGGRVDPRVLAAEALATAPIGTPVIETSPSSDRRLYTQVRTWLWVPASSWRTVTATAVAGRVSSTVSARPVRTVWSMGDGGQARCAGPGIEWHPGAREDSTYCAYTYRHSSASEPDRSYALSVSVLFEVGWTSNTGEGGALAPTTRTATQQVQVGEIQAVETR